jgi:protein involved in polysaccharide export with SLBB domain
MTGFAKTGLAIGGLALLILSGCATDGNIPALDLNDASIKEVSPHRLGSGDRIKVTVYGEDRLTGEYVVNGEGMLAFPLIGTIKADGLTAAEFGQALAGRLRQGILTNPNVAVEVASFRPFFIAGEVERPGRYPTSEGMTVTRAVATAGGYTYRANRRDIFLRRPGIEGERRVPVDADIPIRPGDMIRVGERVF